MSSRQLRAATASAGSGAANTSTAPAARPQAVADAPVRAATQRSTRARPNQLMQMQDVPPVVTFSKRRGEQSETGVSAAQKTDDENITVTPRKPSTPARPPSSRAGSTLFVSAEGSEVGDDSASDRHGSEPSRPDDDNHDGAVDADTDFIVSKLEDLDRAAGELLTMIMPAVEADITQTQQALLSSNDCHQCYNEFDELRKAFSADPYIELALILRKLYSKKPELLTKQGSWRPDAIIYKANLARFMYDMLLHGTSRPSDVTLNPAEVAFAPNIAGPSPQALTTAVELNTQLVIARMALPTIAWEKQRVAEDSFEASDGGPYLRWFALGMAKERLTQQAKQRDFIAKRLKTLKKASATTPEATIQKLNKQYPWSAFKDELVSYCERRYAELDDQIAIAGQAHAITAAIKRELSMPDDDVDYDEDVYDSATASNSGAKDAQTAVQAAEEPERTTATASQLKPSKSGTAAMKQFARKTGSELTRRKSPQSTAVLKTVAPNARSTQPTETVVKPVDNLNKRRREQLSTRSPNKRPRVESSTPLADINPTQDEGPQADFETQDVNVSTAAHRRDARRSDKSVSVESQNDPLPDADDDPATRQDEQGQEGSEAGRMAVNGDGDGEDAATQDHKGDSPETKLRKQKMRKANAAKGSAREHGVSYRGEDGFGNVLFVTGRWTPREEATLMRYITSLRGEDEASYTPEATKLFHRSSSTIRPKARSMKVDLIRHNRGISGLDAGWKKVRLNRECKERLRDDGIDYNTDDEPEGEGMHKKRPEFRK